MDCLKPIIGGCGMPPNFAEKTFADGSQTSKSAKVFSLESFPLYGKTYLCAKYEVLTTNSHGDAYQNSIKYGQFTLDTLSCMKYLVKS